MRVVYLNPVGEIGGAERVLLQVLAQVPRAKPTIERFLVLGSEGRLRSAAESLGVETEVLPLPRRALSFGDSRLRQGVDTLGRLRILLQVVLSLPAMLVYLLRLRKLLRALKPDVVHSNGIKAHLVAALVKPRNAKLVWHVHDFLSDRPLVGRLMRRLARRVSAAIAISEAVRVDAESVLKSVPIVTIYNAVDTERFAPGEGDRPTLDRLAGFESLPSDAVRVGLVATYARWKGHIMFLTAAEIVRRKTPNAPIYFYIVGGPIYHTAGSQFSEEEIRAATQQLGIADRVGLVPFQDDPAPIYRSLDIVLHASTRREPFGLTIVEAMSCGRATIVSLAGGTKEIVEPNVNALGFKPGDVDGLARAMSMLASDESQRVSLGRAGRATALNRFSGLRIGPQFADFYAGLLDEARIGLRNER